MWKSIVAMWKSQLPIEWSRLAKEGWQRAIEAGGVAKGRSGKPEHFSIHHPGFPHIPTNAIHFCRVWNKMFMPEDSDHRLPFIS
jgi:hypothetical protein